MFYFLVGIELPSRGACCFCSHITIMHIYSIVHFSHFLDDLSEVPCHMIVTKSLPRCEHLAEMGCSADPSQTLCIEFCGGTMTCCGRDCKSRCYQCQAVNEEDGRPINRIVHEKHQCQKTLFCEHICVNNCSVDHQHTQICKEPCRQECAHARCKKYCSSPCAPCQEPCTW